MGTVGNDIHFVAVNDGIDSEKGENELTPVKNIFNEWFIRDTSRKIRASHRIKGNSGEPLSKPPYGYKKDLDNKKYWLIDEPAAEVVKRIFSLYLSGKGTEQIGGILQNEQTLTPNAYAKENGFKVSGILSENKYIWRSSTISKILAQQEYCGDIINFKTYSKSYKNKKRRQNDRENWAIFENVNEPIIDRETFNRVQEKRGKVHNKKRKNAEHNMFSGLLVCSDCGGMLHFHFNQGNNSIHYFNCSNNNSRNRTCPTTHYIRTDYLEEIVLADINRLIAFTNQYREQFIKILENNSGITFQNNLKSIETEIERLQKRNTETYSKSFKNKKRYDNAEENIKIFYDANEPIIERTVFETVQGLIKKTKRRAPKPENAQKSIFSGLMRCGDCGHNLRHHTNTKNKSIHYFSCGNYVKDTRGDCPTRHYIREDALFQIVTMELQKLSFYLQTNEDAFVAILEEKTNKDIIKERKQVEDELQKSVARQQRVSQLYTKLYEDNSDGKVSDEWFMEMSHKYEVERVELKAHIATLRTRLGSLEQSTKSRNAFVSAIRKFMTMEALTAPLLQELIDHIDVYDVEGTGKDRTQRVVIFYRFVGYIEIPEDVFGRFQANTRQGVAIEYIPKALNASA